MFHSFEFSKDLTICHGIIIDADLAKEISTPTAQDKKFSVRLRLLYLVYVPHAIQGTLPYQSMAILEAMEYKGTSFDESEA